MPRAHPCCLLTRQLAAPPAMQGGPLGGGDDPYWDAGRVGGTLSHLAREHPPTGAWSSISFVAGGGRPHWPTLSQAQAAVLCLLFRFEQCQRQLAPHQHASRQPATRATGNCPVGTHSSPPPLGLALPSPRPAEDDRRPLDPLHVVAVVKYEATLRLADKAIQGPCELAQRCFARLPAALLPASLPLCDMACRSSCVARCQMRWKLSCLAASPMFHQPHPQPLGGPGV